MTTREYAEAGVDPIKIDPFKETMSEMGKRTLHFPNKWDITIHKLAHAAGYRFEGQQPYMVLSTQEGLGNKNWIADWMYQHAGTGLTYYDGIGPDAMRMALNDNAAHGAQPFMYLDEVAAGDSDWFGDKKRREDLAAGFFAACEEDNIALPAGESPSLRYLIKAEPPVKSAPSLSGCATGFIASADRLITGEKLCAGASILAARSSGLCANGISLVIKRALTLPDKFLTPLNGRTLGEEALIPTRSYIKLVHALLEADVEVLAFLPGTGDGVAKLASDKRPFTYRVHTWWSEDRRAPLFRKMREIGVSIYECLKTFNWDAGFYAFVRPEHVNRATDAAAKIGEELLEVGVVEDGRRGTIFGPENNLWLPPGDVE